MDGDGGRGPGDGLAGAEAPPPAPTHRASTQLSPGSHMLELVQAQDSVPTEHASPEPAPQAPPERARGTASRRRSRRQERMARPFWGRDPVQEVRPLPGNVDRPDARHVSARGIGASTGTARGRFQQSSARGPGRGGRPGLCLRSAPSIPCCGPACGARCSCRPPTAPRPARRRTGPGGLRGVRSGWGLPGLRRSGGLFRR
jgi:hypothetical protein